MAHSPTPKEDTRAQRGPPFVSFGGMGGMVSGMGEGGSYVVKDYEPLAHPFYGRVIAVNHPVIGGRQSLCVNLNQLEQIREDGSRFA